MKSSRFEVLDELNELGFLQLSYWNKLDQLPILLNPVGNALECN